MKKLFLVFLILLCWTFLVGGGWYYSTGIYWDLLDEDCSDISDWNDDDTNASVSEVSPAGQFRFDTNTGAAGNAEAKRSRDIGSFPNEFTVKVKLYHDDIGAIGDVDYLGMVCNQADENFRPVFASDGLFIKDTDSGDTCVNATIVKEAGSAEWQIWWFLISFGVTGDGTCDVYLEDSTHNKSLVGNDVPCSFETSLAADGIIKIFQAGHTNNDMVTHVDYIQIATGLYIP